MRIRRGVWRPATVFTTALHLVGREGLLRQMGPIQHEAIDNEALLRASVSDARKWLRS
jgi:hypothetical protein